MDQRIAHGRIAPLDGLRAFAVSLVLLFHSFPALYPTGSIGVGVFFVISGYVITSHLLRDKPTFPTFYKNRAQRLLPPALLVIAVTWLFGQAGLVEVSGLAVFAAAFSFMNWAIAFPELNAGAGRLAHYWSLSVEEQFYFLWPIVLALLIRWRLDVKKALIAMVVLTALWRLVAFEIGFSPERIYSGLDTRADGLLIGCLLAVVRPRDLGWMPPIAILALVVFGFAKLDYTTLIAQARFPIVLVLSAIAVAGCAWSDARWTAPLNAAPVQWLGLRSYAIYLWHYPFIGVATTLGQEWGVRGAVYIGAAWVATFIASELTYLFIEKPLRQRRHQRPEATVATA